MRDASGHTTRAARAAWATSLVLAFVAGGCAGFRHGSTQTEVEGQVLSAAFGPGAKRLDVESNYDATLRTYVADKGPPDYIYVVSSTQVQLVYVARDEVAVFQRSAWSVEGHVSVVAPIPDALATRLSPADQARLGARHGAPDAPTVPPPALPTLADTVALCRAIQTSPEVPVACQFTYVEGAPAMLLVFPNLETATAYWEAVTQYVDEPFCRAANAANRPAFFMIALAADERARVYACEANEWSDCSISAPRRTSPCERPRPHFLRASSPSCSARKARISSAMARMRFHSST